MQFKMILTSIALCTATLAPVARAQSATDSVILDMQKAYQKGDRQSLSALLARAQGHVLEPWAAYWELSARLPDASAEDVQTFFKKYAGTYQEDRLRNDWLLLLGERQDWSQFARVANEFRMNDDRDVRCYTLAMENRLAGIDMGNEVKTQWFAQRGLGDGCTLAARIHLEAGQLREADVWRKARLTLEAGQRQAVRDAVAMVAPKADKLLARALKDPSRFVLKTPPSNQRLTQELVVLALTRWAAQNPESAAQALETRWAKHLTAEQQAWAWGSIGKQAMQKLLPDALAYFAHVRPAALRDDHLAWRARAALRQQRWDEVLAAIKAMSPDAASDATWIYWRARALQQTDTNESAQQQARALLQSIASVRGFYPMLAQEALGLPLLPPPEPAPLTPEERAAATANPGLQRALAAFALGLRNEGVREWNYTTNLHAPGGMTDRELLAAADLACHAGVWDRCINTSERTRDLIDLTQRFPMPHHDAVIERSHAIGLDPAYVYGLIRQESRFIIDARSGVGAAGLMQVMPKTARWTAKQIGLTDFKVSQLNERDTNIAIGTGYLKLVLDDFSGSMPLATAAYNAGPSRSRRWRSAVGVQTLDAAIWAETIPFNETRDYVKKVLANTTIYAAMISGQTQSLRAYLGHISPHDANTPENRDLP